MEMVLREGSRETAPGYTADLRVIEDPTANRPGRWNLVPAIATAQNCEGMSMLVYYSHIQFSHVRDAELSASCMIDSREH